MISPTRDVPDPADSGPDPELRLSSCEEPLSWSALFANANPVEVELGCGKGRFIISSARGNPDVNYFGIEKSKKFFRLIKQRVAKKGLPNIRLLQGEAAYFIGKYMPEQSVRAFHIYFPDPWPKKRHHKRRLVNNGFLQTLAVTLGCRGRIFVATDFEDYFHQIVAAARRCQELGEVSVQTIQPPDADPEAAATNYERKYLLLGRPIYKALYEKA